MEATVLMPRMNETKSFKVLFSFSASAMLQGSFTEIFR